VTWADSVPNLLIGLREGLEAGLVVTILLAALRKTAVLDKAGTRAERAGAAGTRAPSGSTAPIWLGVLGAVTLSCAFAAVATFSVSALSSAAREAIGGLLSVLAVCLVTAMIFWMRRTAAGLPARLRGEVERAAAVGAGALTLTAFLSVSREGLETTLFLWTAAKASGQTAAPLAGAATGIAGAIALCRLLYRRAVHLNVGVFFTRTAIALIVIAAGVLAYGLGDLQEAGWLPGRTWIAFDLTAHVDQGSWWASVITGVTELSPKMTVLQVTAWVAYLLVVIPAFVNASVNAGRAPAAAGAGEPVAARRPGRWERVAGGRPWLVAGVLIAIPALAAGATIASLPAPAAGPAAGVTVSRSRCAPEWTSADPGTQMITVTNNSGLAGEITLDDASGAVIGELETIGPGTSVPLPATLGAGTYTFKCLLGRLAATESQPVTVSASAGPADSGPGAAPVAVKPVTVAELAGPNELYQAYADAQLTDLAEATAAIEADLRHGDLTRARRDWLTAQLDWERAAASYNSFGDLGVAVDGLPGGLPGGVNDKGFTGLHRIEYGLWHGQPASELLPVAAALGKDVAAVRKNRTSGDLAGDPVRLPLRAHEIIEDALRDHLSAADDEGSGAGYPMTYADTQVDKAVLGYLAGLIGQREPGLVTKAGRQLAALDAALLASKANGQWPPLTAVSLEQRQRVDAAMGALLETLAAVPDLLEVPPAH